MISRITSLALISLFLIFVLNVFQITPALEAENTNKANKDISNEIDLPFNYIVVSGKDALETCLRLREENKENITPVILGTYDDLKMHKETASFNTDSTEDIIKKSLEYNVEDLLNQRFEEDPEAYSYVELGQWPSTLSPITSITANTDIMTGEFLDEVYIGLIPTGNSYEVPAYIKFGGWNACPSPEEQIAILKYWYNKYGAQVISMTSATLECTVDNPPETKEDSIDLAKDQFIYCSDIVTQGTETISGLAGYLYESKYWFFWWD